MSFIIIIMLLSSIMYYFKINQNKNKEISEIYLLSSNNINSKLCSWNIIVF